MSVDAWLTLLVIAGVFVVMARDVASPAVALFTGITVLMVSGVLTPAQAFQGFSNPAPITVAALYVLARAVEKSGAMQPVVKGMLGRGTGARTALARLSVPVAAASAFLNNTPIVAMLVPQVTEWADRNRRSPSRFLMPLSFAASLGGMATLIGTSTNLVVSGLLEASGHEPLGMFELSRVGLPVALSGILLITLLAPLVLPERRPPREQAEDAERTFTVQMNVLRDGPLDGAQVEDGGLRHLQGVFLVELERDGETDRARRAHHHPAGRGPTHLRRPGRHGRRPAVHRRPHLRGGSTPAGLRQPATHVLRSGRGWHVRPRRSHAQGRRLPRALPGGSGGHPPRRPARARQARPGAPSGRRHAAPHLRQGLPRPLARPLGLPAGEPTRRYGARRPTEGGARGGDRRGHRGRRGDRGPPHPAPVAARRARTRALRASSRPERPRTPSISK